MYEFFGIVSRFENPTPKTIPNLFRDWSGVQSLGFWFAMVFEDDEDEREREAGKGKNLGPTYFESK